MEPITLLILAGGRSSRMGRDKAWLEWEGRPLIEHVMERLLPLAAEVLISTNDPARYVSLADGRPMPIRLVADEFSGAGPLAGLHAGLKAARNDLLFAVATDMPFVSAEAAEYVLKACADVDAALPRVLGQEQESPQAEPLFAAYRKSCRPAIEASLTAGRRRLVSFLDNVRVRYVEEADLRRWDPELMSLRNLNTPDELRAAKSQPGARRDD